MALHVPPDTNQVRADFDEIGRLANPGASGVDVYDALLLSLIPAGAVRVLEIGCGLGRLASAIAASGREIACVDLSPTMIERARLRAELQRASFESGDFLEVEFGGRLFDCVISAATLHHMPADQAISRMAALVRPGGRLIVQDLRRDASIADAGRAYVALAGVVLGRLVRARRPWNPRPVRQAWARHGARETYLSLDEARQLADRLLPGAQVFNHWLWRYTIVWDRPPAS